MAKFLDADEFSVDDVFKGKYIIPVYQRPYKWEIKQVKQLLDDIEEVYNNCKSDGSIDDKDDYLFAGTMFIKDSGKFSIDLNEYRVVDGQQRITTLTLIMMAILNHLYQIQSEDDVVTEIRNYLWKKTDRKNDKNKRALTLGNIDRPIMERLFNELFEKHDIESFANSEVDLTDNEIEKNLLSNLIFIIKYFNKFNDENEYYDYFEFIKEHVKFIGIRINTDMVKLFSIFESINSKGKTLEEIDLIKSYIFQNLNESDYDDYLEKWGKLIKDTNDHLDDYLTLFIRAHIAYYRYSIKLDNFKALSMNSLKSYYGIDSLPDMLKCFIDDMLNQVKYYQRINDVNLLEKDDRLSPQTLAVLRMNQICKYNNMSPLVFSLLEYKDKGMDVKYLDSLVEYAFRFLLTFQTISARESKHSINAFSDVQDVIYEAEDYYGAPIIFDDSTEDKIITILNKRIFDNAIDNRSLKSSIKNTMTYNKNKGAVKVLLTYLLENKTEGPDYHMINTILKLKDDIQVDHILPRRPTINDGFDYYSDGDVIALKDDQDFTRDKTIKRIPERDFDDSYLHKLGNLRLEWANENAKKSCHMIKLEEFDHVYRKYEDVRTREDDLVNKVIESNWLLSTDNITYNPETISNAKRIIDLDSDNYQNVDLKQYHPVAFTFLDNVFYVDDETYKNLVVSCAGEICNTVPQKITALAKIGFYPTDSNNPYIADDPKALRSPVIIQDGVWVETNITSFYSLKLLFSLMDEVGLDDNNLIIECEEN